MLASDLTKIGLLALKYSILKLKPECKDLFWNSQNDGNESPFMLVYIFVMQKAGKMSHMNNITDHKTLQNPTMSYDSPYKIYFPFPSLLSHRQG